MKWFVTDAETNIHNRGEGAVGSMQAHPAHADNGIVSIGEQWSENKQLHYQDYYNVNGVTELPRFLKHALAGKDTLLVMHNVPFDFSYIVKTWPTEVERALPHLFVWDTMQVAYLLSGQDKTMPSLDKESEELGLPLKDDRLKQYWADGVDTAFIPKDILLPYQRQDVLNTTQIFLDQWNTVSQNPKMLELVRLKMDDKLFTTYMQIYGMHFDLTKAATLLKEVDREAQELYDTIMEETESHFSPDFEFNPSSPQHVSALLFGGDYAVEHVLPVLDEEGQPVKFKSGRKKGEVKTKKVKSVYKTAGLKLPTKNIPTNANGYSTSDEHLSKLKHPLPEKLLAYRGLVKDKSTYYVGYSKYVWPDGCIRPNINHEVTETGRQSSSSPNLQNVSKEEEK